MDVVRSFQEHLAHFSHLIVILLSRHRTCTSDYSEEFAMKFKVYRTVNEIMIEHEFELGEFNCLEVKLLIGRAYVQNVRTDTNKIEKTIKDFIDY